MNQILVIFLILGGLQVLPACESTIQTGTLGAGQGSTNGTILTPLSPAATSGNILIGEKAYDSNGKVLIGTIPIGSNVIGANGTLSSLIPLGYYDGTQSLSTSDTNLIGSNIISGVTIFGVSGTAVGTACTGSNQSGCIASVTYPTQSTPGTPAGVANVLSGKQFYAGGAQITGTMPNQGNWNENTTAFPGAGYYSSLTSTLTTSNVCTGTNVYGSAGAAVCEGTSGGTNATASQVLTGTYFWNSVGTSTAGTMTSRGSFDQSATFPGSGFYNGSVTNTPTGSQIASGSTILGVAGGYTGSFGALTASSAFRDKSTAQITLQTEVTTNAAIAYTNATAYGSSTGYRAVPDINKDDDGYSGVNVSYVNRTGWTNSCDSVTGANGGSANSACTCGLSGTIATRIVNCAAHAKIGANATWSGSTNGSSGEATWKLVTRTANISLSKGREVWQDQRTMQIWSSAISSGITWCKASGSNNIAGNPTAQADSGGYCNSGIYQNTAGLAISACFEDGVGTNFTQTDAAIDSAGKGGLGIASTPLLAWRLPTLHDYEQAEVDGIRFVMADLGLSGNGYEWTATVYSNTHNNAWVFHSSLGIVSSSTRNSLYTMRCVGR